MKAKAS